MFRCQPNTAAGMTNAPMAVAISVASTNRQRFRQTKYAKSTTGNTFSKIPPANKSLRASLVASSRETAPP